MLKLIRTNSNDKDFIQLVNQLDKELTIRDGDEHDFYDQFNKIDNIKYVVVAYENEKPVSCGAIKEFDVLTMEVKRMFTQEDARGKGIASKVLYELEKWAAELGYQKCILETGVRQPEAIRLYTKSGYELIENYGQYKGVENSRCFEKHI
ncbi:MAG: GNAT family N-acetyltransferase [Flavobacteriaceae bacterium]